MSTVTTIQPKSGFTRMDNDLYEALIGAELSGRELRVALAIHRQTAGYNLESACIAASYIAQMSGIRREDVSRAISELLRQGVIHREGGSRSPIGFAPVGEWKIDKKTLIRTNQKKCHSVAFPTRPMWRFYHTIKTEIQILLLTE